MIFQSITSIFQNITFNFRASSPKGSEAKDLRVSFFISWATLDWSLIKYLFFFFFEYVCRRPSSWLHVDGTVEICIYFDGFWEIITVYLAYFEENASYRDLCLAVVRLWDVIASCFPAPQQFSTAASYTRPFSFHDYHLVSLARTDLKCFFARLVGFCIFKSSIKHQLSW